LWWQHGLVYEAYPRSFQDTDGDGVGDLPGISSRLDYLQWLGVDAIWVPPFYRSPMADFGYDVSDHTAVDPIFGTLQDFDDLLAQAHEKGIRLLVDFVPNHTSDEHPWFEESRSSRTSPKRDWYLWRDAGPTGEAPNNWINIFTGESAWTFDTRTGQYYLHTFSAQQPDLNWRNPLVKQAMFDVARFWLERGVDGFRIDVAHLIMKDPLMRDNPPNPDPAQMTRIMGEWGKQLHVNDLAHPDVHGVYREFRRLLDSYSAGQPRLSIGELHRDDLEDWASYYGAELDELHMPFNFHLMWGEWGAREVREVVESVEAATPDGAWPNWVWGNHDQSRIASRVGPVQSRLAMMLLLTLRGAPTLYYGDELGMVDVAIPPEKAKDTWEKYMPGRGRDPQRTPMRWDDTPNAGFCAPGKEPWLPIGHGFEHTNVAAQARDPGSMLSLTRALIQARRAIPALGKGEYVRVKEKVPEDCFVYLRTHEVQTVVVALNFSSEERCLALPRFGAAEIRVSTHLDREGPTDLARLRLRANEGCVILP
jgi:alpha-glucosidase